jgi:DNA topoisomerase-2
LICSQVSFTVTALSGAKLDEAEKAPGGLLKKFKLESSMATSNMNFFDSGGVAIERYSTPFDICKAFYKVRLETYAKRKAHLVKQKKGQVNVLRNKVRFILAVLSEELIVHNRKKAELLAQLVEDGYDAVIPESAKKPKTAANADDDASDDEEAPKQIEEPDDLRTLAKGYDYLLSMRLWALTRERVDALRGELSEKDAELRTLQATATTDLWLTDLQALEEQLDIDDAKREAGEADAAKKAKAHASKKGKKVRRCVPLITSAGAPRLAWFLPPTRSESRSRAGRLETSAQEEEDLRFGRGERRLRRR